jgi:hypothetical protein
MTKRRASIRGQEAESLLGEEPAGDIEPSPSGELQAKEAEVAAPAAVRGSGPDALGEELERALHEEARAGAPLPPGSQARSLPWEEEVLFSPAVEAAMIEEAFAAEGPPEPVIEVPAPAWDGGAEESFRSTEGELFRLPPPQVENLATGVLPPRVSRPFLERYSEPEALDIQQPESDVKQHELPERDLTPEQQQAILDWWGSERIQQMSSDIDTTYQEVRQKVGENDAITTEAYNLLLKARDILIRRDAQRIAQAEYYIEQVRVRLKRAAQSEASAKKIQWPLLFWGLLWGAAFLAVLILAGVGTFQGLFRPAGEAQSLVEMNTFLSAMLWGGIGGAVAVLYSLFKHIGMRDFDPQYIISYVGKPFMGLIVGATAYMLIALMVRALGIVPAAQTAVEGDALPTIAPGVVYLVAWVAGFKENRLLELVDRLMKRVFGPSDKEKEQGAAPATLPPL